MQVIKVYKCLCNLERLRILNLLRGGPLCVCHLMEILGLDQVKISKQLRYMKVLGAVESTRKAQWMVYKLPANPNTLLEQNLKCLQDVATEEVCFADDLRKRAAILSCIEQAGSDCPEDVFADRKA